MKRKLLRRAGIWPFRWLSEPGLRLLSAVYRDRPVPLRMILGLRKAALGPDALARNPGPEEPSSLSDPNLRRLLAGRKLGEWALGVQAIEGLERVFVQSRPELTIEFGSGTSTLCLAYFAQRSGLGLNPSIVSIEQDADHADRTRAALYAAGLQEVAAVIHAPIAPVNLGDRDYSGYFLPDKVEEVVAERLATLVLVDGPAAESGARYATVVAVRRWLRPGAIIILDDALRDGELDTARRWQASGWVRVRGVVIKDKGVLHAEVTS